jgi:hypothetical protein
MDNVQWLQRLLYGTISRGGSCCCVVVQYTFRQAGVLLSAGGGVMLWEQL